MGLFLSGPIRFPFAFFALQKTSKWFAFSLIHARSRRPAKERVFGMMDEFFAGIKQLWRK